MEQAMGHVTNNIITVLQHEKQISLQEAANLVGEHFRELCTTFEEDKARLPSYGEETDKVAA